MNWVKPQYKPSQIENHGKKLIDPKITEEEYYQAMEVLSNWRASHAFPLNYFQSWLRREARNLDKDCLVTQRLKRTPSIKRKLEKSTTKLNQMQDIGGCRAILKNIRTVYQLRDRLFNTTRNSKLIKKDDYIQSPRNSGYRGIHLIYKYEGNSDYNNHKIEIQLRSYIQHYWATSVEIAGAFTQQNLKNGEGDENWLLFFKYTSIILAFLEDYVQDITKEKLSDTAKEVKKLMEKLNVRDILTAFPLTIKENLEKEVDKEKYFLLILNTKEKTIEGESYTPRKFTQATENYKKLEEENKNNPFVDVVLVKSESIKKLKKEYPNYFADSQAFLNCLDNGFKKIL